MNEVMLRLEELLFLSTPEAAVESAEVHGDADPYWDQMPVSWRAVPGLWSLVEPRAWLLSAVSRRSS
ncbi:hypothetical protein [Streptomyces nigrescens]|uniref:Uncharacterized protein n=2 Tax=Streptomyces nigrescens TaxID=1920 RepID=A0ABY7ISV5_STRNI|nr:hypothetical protein [Streptomyces libani]MCX5449498.1 hypothetical protein [Streptomyces libani]WAU02042.1 hypothetical protein STRLI_000120 [Streptomyces libani subsp. libani]